MRKENNFGRRMVSPGRLIVWFLHFPFMIFAPFVVSTESVALSRSKSGFADSTVRLNIDKNRAILLTVRDH
jgi:hypothetical protein